MNMALRYLVAVMASLCVGTFASQAPAQPNRASQAQVQLASPREAAVKRCMAEARAHYRGPPVSGADQPRYFAYVSCMRDTGFTP
jgi:hypothetical protein